MKKRIYSGAVAVTFVAAFSFSANSVYASGLPYGVQYAYDGSDYGAKAGYIQLNGNYQPGQYVSLSDTDGMGIHGGTDLFWEGQSTNVHYVYGKAFFPNESTPGTVLNYALDNKTTDNGYLLVSTSNIQDWVTYLGGNLSYVQATLQNEKSYSQMDDLSGGGSWEVANLSDTIAACGATINYAGKGAGSNYYVNADGTTADPAFNVTPTPVPTSSINLSQSTYGVGSTIPINLTADVYAANTNWHLEAVHVTGNGVDTYVPIQGQTQAATGTDFDHMAWLKGGGSGNPSTPTEYKDVANWDTTGLQAGTYNIDYILYDAVDRISTSGTNGVVSTTVTLVPGVMPTQPTNPTTPSNPTPSPSPTGGSQNTKMNLSVKYDPFTQPVAIGTANIPVTVSNNGDQAVTTTVTLTRKGYNATPVYSTTYDANGNPTGTYVSGYNNFPDTVTLSQNVTIPAHGAKQLTFSVFTGKRMSGVNYDQTYNFEIVADVNPSHNPVEWTNSDNEATEWVKTAGPTTKPPGAVLSE